MNDKSKYTQFQMATASTLKAISGEISNEREVKFSGTASLLSSKEIRLPQIIKDLNEETISTIRGESDKIALKIKYHDPLLHSKIAPSSDLSSQIFQIAEDARVEALGTKNLIGLKNNLKTLLDNKFKIDFVLIPLSNSKHFFSSSRTIYSSIL